MIYDLIIVGGGPAGLNAAIYGSRAGLKCAIIEKEAPGGKIIKTEKIENYLGSAIVDGVELATSMFNHALLFGCEYLYGDVKKISKKDDLFTINCESETFKSKSVIIATGTKERKLGIPGEDKYYGRGVSYCAICDGGLYKGQVMTVIGGGNSALQEALYLSKLAKKVYLVHRRDEFRGEDYLAEQVKKQSNIELMLKKIPTEIKGDEKVHQIVLEDVDSKESVTLDTEVIFPMIGFDPVTSFVDKDLLDSAGYLLVDENLQTKIEGLFGAGDVIKKQLRQIITAASDGALAATQAAHYIQNNK